MILKRIILFSMFLIAINISAQGTRKLDQKVLNQLNTDSNITELGRYMEPSNCSDTPLTNFPKWEGFPLWKCRYKVLVNTVQEHIRSQQDLAGGTRTSVTAEVIMLNPGAGVLSKWILATCMLTHPDATESQLTSCSKNFAKDIKVASGSQFAVAGIVLEDQYWYPVGYGQNKAVEAIKVKDGMPEAYLFRDGVTVKLKGSRLNNDIQQIFDQSDINFALDPASIVDKVSTDEGPARIARTSRDEYIKLMRRRGKNIAVISDTDWLKIVRESYQDAWKRAHNNSLEETVDKYRNDLLLAKRPAI